MNKISKILITALLASCFALGFSSCLENEKPPVDGGATHDEIVADFAALRGFAVADVAYNCYGEFGGAHVLTIHHKNARFDNEINNITVDGVEYHFPVVKSFSVYRGGEFCTIQQAFDNGWLTHENLLTVQATHRAENEEAYENFEEHRTIIEEFASQYRTEARKVTYHCYGEFDGTHAMLCHSEDWGYPAAIWHDCADGVYYHFGHGDSFYVYHDGGFYTLQEAFDNGWLTHENLLTVRDNYMPDGGKGCPICDGHEKILDEYAEQFNVRFWEIDYYNCYGEFDGTHVMVILCYDDEVDDAINCVWVDGVDFYFNKMINFVVYHGGRFYTLQQAFDNGWLTHENLLTVRANHRAENEALYEEFEREGSHDGDNANAYRLTVVDPNGFVIEQLQATYRAGERVTVKVTVLYDAGLNAYLDGVSLGSETPVSDNGEYHWEFYFVMPEHDAVLSFATYGGI